MNIIKKNIFLQDSILFKTVKIFAPPRNRAAFIHCGLFVLFTILWCNGISQNRADSLEILLNVADTPDRRVEIILSLAIELKDKEPAEALNYARQALEMSENNLFSDAIIRSKNCLAEIYIYLTEYQKAMEMASQAMSEAEKQDNEPGLINALFNIGTIYNDLGDYEKSSENFFNSLRRSEQTDNKELIAKALNSIGLLYHNKKNYDKAQEYYFKAQNISKEIGDRTGVAKGLNNLAAIYGAKGEHAKARSFLMEALKYNLSENDFDMAGINYLNLGYYYQEMKQFDSAIIFYNKAKAIYMKLGKPSAIVRTHVFLTEYYLAIGDLDDGLYYAKEAMAGATRLGLKKLMYETASLLNIVYLKNGDSLEGYKYQILKLQMKDSLNIEEKQTELSRLELQYSLEKAEQKNKADQQRRSLIQIIIWITFFFAIVFFVMLWMRVRLKAKAIMLEKEKLMMDLELRSKELTSNAMNLMKKNETLAKIATRLKTLQKEADGQETRTALSKIRVELSKLAEDEGWEEFEMRFNQVHGDFYNHLLKEFPDLSPQELRLSAFLRLNMTTKEISDLTGQSITALEMSRTRLRKKLGLTNTATNLITFLNQF